MTPRVREHGPDKRAQGVWGVQDLRVRPVPAGLSYYGDRALEYLWGGPKTNWTINPPGFSIFDDFQNWTRDYTVDFDGYFHNGGEDALGGGDGNQFYIMAPLGPRYSCWHLDMCYWRGPQAGSFDIDVCTVPFFRDPRGILKDWPPEFASGLENYDIANPILSNYYGPWQPQPPGTENADGFEPDDDSHDGPLWHHFTSLGMFTEAIHETYDWYATEVGTTFRLMGEYGQLLSNTDLGASQADEDDPPASSPHTGVSWDSGDGVMYYFRFRIDESLKDPECTDSGAGVGRIQAVRLVRAIEDDGTAM